MAEISHSFWHGYQQALSISQTNKPCPLISRVEYSTFEASKNGSINNSGFYIWITISSNTGHWDISGSRDVLHQTDNLILVPESHTVERES